MHQATTDIIKEESGNPHISTEETHSHGCHGHCHEHQHAEEISQDTLKSASETVAIFRITKMDCPMEEQLIRKRLKKVQGINSLSFNLMQRVLTVDHVPGNTPEIIAALKDIDMDPEELKPGLDTAQMPATAIIPWKKLIWAGIIALLSEITELLGEWNSFFHNLRIANFSLMEILAFLLAIVAILLSGLVTYKKGWLAIKNLKLNINALMAVAVTGAVLIGQFPEAAMVMVLFNISEAIEALSLDRARAAIKNLMNLSPKLMTVRMENSEWMEKPVNKVTIGAIARVRPGEKIGLDGIVISGESQVNQAAITGESMPVEKQAGDFVYGGTLNESGSFEYRVTANANDTTLARIIHAVEEAQATKAPMQRFVDVFAQYYTPCVFILALVWAIVPPLFFSEAWLPSIYTALVLLVIGCPCALVISTPVTVVSGMASATKKGILVKGGLYLEHGRKLNCIAFDKTGTLTSGKPAQTNFEFLDPLAAEEGESMAVSLAAMSDHPVSKAIAEYGMRKGIKIQKVSDFKQITGRGVEGLINGEKWQLGNLRLVSENGLQTEKLEKQTRQLENSGKTVVLLMNASSVIALFGVADTIRKTSAEAVAKLERMHVKTVMLTGDNTYTAKAIAQETGVNEYRANLLPNQKLEIINELENQGYFVGMAGDGINDAPSLAKADIGFAMAAGGTDTAMETADVALMDDDLRKIPAFIKLSMATYAILWENIIFALAIKAVFFVLTLTGNATMWMAVFADVGAALLVVANGLRMMKK